MKKIILILLLTLPVYTQVVNSVKITPFINFGSYNNNSSSASFSFYSSLNLFNYDYLSLGFDQLKIDNQQWEYEQSTYVAGYTSNFYPFYLSFNYGYVAGDYTAKLFPLVYSDDINIYNGKITYNTDLVFLSGSFSHLNIRGIKRLISNQTEGAVIFVPSVKLSFGLSILSTNQDDGRDLLGTEIFASYRNDLDLVFTGKVFLGERAYYFSPALFTIFNQNETQKGNYKLQVDYLINNLLTASGVYQHSVFDGYRIDYFSIGLSYLINTSPSTD